MSRDYDMSELLFAVVTRQTAGGCLEIQCNVR